jgi:transposase
MNDFLTVNDQLNVSMKTTNGQLTRIEKRAQIAVFNDCGVDTRTIAWFVNLHLSTVRRWILRVKNGHDLCDKNRSGRPPRYSEKIELKTIAFYCQVSPLPGCNAWSLRWAQDYLKEHKEIIGCAMSHSTIQRILKKHSLRPHMHKYFLAITDPDFFPKMDSIIDLYLNPPEYLFNFDECTGVQARAPLNPDLPAAHGKPKYEEFDYVRNGTIDLMAFLNPKTGEVFGRCTPNHNTGTLVQVFKEHVNTLPPDASIHYIMDNLNTHFNDEFCKTVAELSGVTYTPLKPGAQRRQWLQEQDKRIVIHFLPFHGSWLNRVEVWFGILKKKCLKNQSFLSVQNLKEIIEQFIDTWNHHFAHPFTWKYTGEGLFEKAISRFIKLLLIESKQMDVKFLTKQLLLMANIPNTYKEATKTGEWKQLVDLFCMKTDFIKNIISRSEKKRQKDNLSKALDKFVPFLPQPVKLNILNCQN